jgi:multidrug efflux pump subunit AcrB
VNRVALPNDAKSPVITEVNTDTKEVFELYIYSKSANTSKEILMNKAKKIKDEIEKLGSIESVKFSGGEDYEMHIVIDTSELKAS